MARCSAATHASASTTAPAKSAITRADAQPHAGPSLTPSSRQISQPPSRTAESQLTPPLRSARRSGTTRNAATVLPTVTTSGIQNSQW